MVYRLGENQPEYANQSFGQKTINKSISEDSLLRKIIICSSRFTTLKIKDRRQESEMHIKQDVIFLLLSTFTY